MMRGIRPITMGGDEDEEEYREEGREEEEAYEEEGPEMAPIEPPAAPARYDAPRRSRPRASLNPQRSKGMTPDQSEIGMFAATLRAVHHTHVICGREGDAIEVGDLPTVTLLAK